MTRPLHDVDTSTLRRRTSIKWRAYPEDVLPLWVAEMDTTPAPAVVDAITQALTDGDTGYPVSSAACAEPFAAFAAERWGWAHDPARTVVVPDVMTGLRQVLEIVTGPGDAVVVNPPVYPPFFGSVERTGRRLVAAPLGDDGRIDLDVLDSAFAVAAAGGGRPAYLLCSPHNPTGTVPTLAELTAVAELAARHGVRVVADEIHAPLVPTGAVHVPYLSVPGAGDAIALFSAAKAWNLAGLKAAIAVSGPEGLDDLRRLPDLAHTPVSHLAMIAHAAAFRDGGDWLDAVLRDIAANRVLLADLVAERLPTVGYRPRRAPTWPGSTAGRSGWATTPRRSSWSVAGSR
ncbi:aminotransferase class I/II-fold pyridoxal phosphate-dependent enzyme [Cellulomonas sp. P24]|uniref:aminotransferase class I/II-fold pyridoxal phosphate-dependent enzyme n=1 Tax=Cellulomonas sp. P24 TaxID=2885206 RepID=UPI00286FB204|nr:aminotransferase class I/II-fold pyridoxal phosphate-dependent enzyme [Cellulomonas sp. P24]MCR6491859.1 aminotransferase class I/II-fold pyridoxal phosphate-dependent enzyme [Cellulomonas sp. P24]